MFRQALWNCSHQSVPTEADGVGRSVPKKVKISSPSSAASSGSSARQTATVQELPSFPYTEGQQAVKRYVEQTRLTSSWKPSRPEDQERLLLTERRKALRLKSLMLLFVRSNQRAGFTRKPICPSMLRDTYALHFLQVGGELTALQGQLGVADLASVRRYQRIRDE